MPGHELVSMHHDRMVQITALVLNLWLRSSPSHYGVWVSNMPPHSRESTLVAPIPHNGVWDDHKHIHYSNVPRWLGVEDNYSLVDNHWAVTRVSRF